MVSRLSESAVYRHLWTTGRGDAIFGETERMQSWLAILEALAQAQAELGLVPPGVAAALRDLDAADLDVDRIAAETRATGHSTLGLIRELQRVLPAEVGEWVYYGATVQDVTDTWFGLVMREVTLVVRADVRSIELALLDLAATHHTTPMTGRTHGQAGAPISFGLKVATWADELHRHGERLEQGRARWEVGQLAGAVGALGFFGAAGPALRQRFCALLDLGDPEVSWTTSRDRVVEFAQVLVLVAGTLARIGNEVLELQRPEIDELREAPSATGVGSITMPHKRNPEIAEHLETLSRLARAQLTVLAEGLSGSHERDGRAWKAEWVALPEVCLLTMTSLELGGQMVAGLEVDAAAMQRNLAERGATMGSERLLAGLAARVGKQRAQTELQRVLHDEGGGARRLDRPALVSLVSSLSGTPVDEVECWLDADPLVAATAMVDRVVRRGRAAGPPQLSLSPQPPRHRLACLPTPLHRLTGLERELDLDELWVKRDDLTGFALAGNKARPLEFLIGDALASGCDVIVTGGGAGSNFCQAVAAAAASVGLDCDLLIAGPAADTVNLRIARDCGAAVSFTGQADRASVDPGLAERAARLTAAGRRPYVLPRGGATAVGALGYALAVSELQQQLDRVGVHPAAVVVPTGSGGTQSGLVAGAAAYDVGWAVHGASVSRPPAEMSRRVADLADACAQLLGVSPSPRSAVRLTDARGVGFGVAAPQDAELSRQVLRSDGLLLDVTYTAKALRVAIDLARTSAGPVVFWHTGGSVSAVSVYAGAGAAT